MRLENHDTQPVNSGDIALLTRPQTTISSPTGKSLRIFGNRVKPRNKKYFAFTVSKIRLHLWLSRPARGAHHDRQDRWDGSRWTLVVPITNGTRAYGKGVWS